jgi:hypothetical protein
MRAPRKGNGESRCAHKALAGDEDDARAAADEGHHAAAPHRRRCLRGRARRPRAQGEACPGMEGSEPADGFEGGRVARWGWRSRSSAPSESRAAVLEEAAQELVRLQAHRAPAA